MRGDIEKVIIPRDRLAQRVQQLATQISRDLDELSRDAPIVLVAVLTGSIIFIADLIRRLPQKMRIDLVAVSSYPGSSTLTRGAQIEGELPAHLEANHVLLVDDILDSGGTVRLLQEKIAEARPKSLRTCVLLRKEVPGADHPPCEYVGFDIPNEFVVGYGLDYDNYYRNLPDICALKKDAM